MTQLVFPFPNSRFNGKGPGSWGNDLARFSPELRQAAQEKKYLATYLKALPIDEIGVPTFYATPTRDLYKLDSPNLIYPINDGLFIHIYPDATDERDYYVPIEPNLAVNVDDLEKRVDRRFLEMAEEISETKDDEARRQVLLECLDRIITTNAAVNNGKIAVTYDQSEALRYLTVRNKVGLGVLQPLLLDPNIEDISCSGVGHVFIEHKIFKSLKAATYFSDLDELDRFVVWMGERIKRPVTLRNPIVDAVLLDGSRVNIVFGRDIAKRGSNFTIRKFAEEPLSVLDLIEFGSLDYLIAAYLWLVIEEGLNVFVVGATASGKTTLLNALTTFIRPDSKVVSIEDTPELQMPQQNWLREVVRDMGKQSQSASVDMFALLKAALRQRPERIMIGEIRGVEGNIAFQAMQTGHGVMATFHASSVQKLIQRLTGDPINVPKPNIDNLDVVVIQSAVRGPDGKTVRRVVSVNEIVDYDAVSNTFLFITAFRWKSDTDVFEFPGDMSSFVLEEKIARMRGLPTDNKRAIYSELNRRARVLEQLKNRGGVNGFYQLFQVLAEARKQGLV
jgi:flagellar protein FlaI